MKIKFIHSITAALLCLCAVTSCESGGGDEPDQNLKASRMDLSGATALTILSNNNSRGETTEEFFDAGLFKIDKDGNISTVAVYLITDTENGNTSNKEIPARVVPYQMKDLGDNYLALRGCSYVSLEDGSGIYMPPLYQELLVRKSDGRIFGFGDNEMLKEAINPDNPMVVAGPDEIYFLDQGHRRMVCMKFDGQQLTCQEVGSNGIVEFYLQPYYANGNIYTWTQLCAGICFGKGGYDIFEKDTFGKPDVSSFLIVNDGFAAIRCADPKTWKNEYDLSFNIIDAPRPGAATLTTVASLTDAPLVCSRVYGSYDNGKKVILQHKDPDPTIQQFDPREKAGFSVVDKTAGTWEWLETEFDDAEGITLSASNYYKGRIWGVKEVKGKLQPTALWINPSTLESGTVDLDFDVNGIDIRDSEKDYGNGRLIIYGTRRADNANVVIEANITTGNCTTIFSNPNYEVTTLVPLN